MRLTNTPVLLKKKDVCQCLSMSARTLEGLVRDGRFPPPVRMGKHVYWCETAVTSWMNRMFGAQQSWRPN